MAIIYRQFTHPQKMNREERKKQTTSIYFFAKSIYAQNYCGLNTLTGNFDSVPLYNYIVVLTIKTTFICGPV